jgi:hypothetical protein
VLEVRDCVERLPGRIDRTLDRFATRTSRGPGDRRGEADARFQKIADRVTPGGPLMIAILRGGE